MDDSQRRMLIGAGAAVVGGAVAARAMRYSFRDKVVLVTGGSRGLGLAMSRRLVREGARLAICARDPDEVERAAEDLRGMGGDVIAAVCDVTQESEASWMVDWVIDRWGRIDVLINNAGIIRMGPYEETTPEDYQDLLDTHLFGSMHMVNAVVPHMKARRRGRIVNISSIGGLVSIPHLPAYSASKHALTGYSRGITAELARFGIRVTTVCPGVMRTGSPVRAQFKGRNHLEQTWFTITASLPGTSKSADRSAVRILEACRNGRARLIVSTPAKLAFLADALAPGVVSGAFGALERLLPRAGGIGTEWAEGLDSKSRLSPSPLTVLTQRAAARFNEVPPGREWVGD